MGLGTRRPFSPPGPYRTLLLLTFYSHDTPHRSSRTVTSSHACAGPSATSCGWPWQPTTSSGPCCSSSQSACTGWVCLRLTPYAEPAWTAWFAWGSQDPQDKQPLRAAAAPALELGAKANGARGAGRTVLRLACMFHVRCTAHVLAGRAVAPHGVGLDGGVQVRDVWG